MPPLGHPLYTLPCLRFTSLLAEACARLGADVVRYAFIVIDLHYYAFPVSRRTQTVTATVAEPGELPLNSLGRKLHSSATGEEVGISSGEAVAQPSFCSPTKSGQL